MRGLKDYAKKITETIETAARTILQKSTENRYEDSGANDNTSSVLLRDVRYELSEQAGEKNYYKVARVELSFSITYKIQGDFDFSSFCLASEIINRCNELKEVAEVGEMSTEVDYGDALDASRNIRLNILIKTASGRI